jgi:hypothetical protein
MTHHTYKGPAVTLRNKLQQSLWLTEYHSFVPAVQLCHKLCQQCRPLAAHIACGVHCHTSYVNHLVNTTLLLLLLLLYDLCTTSTYVHLLMA